jgi:predicted RNA-binding protein YlxR (DUF448 family)
MKVSPQAQAQPHGQGQGRSVYVVDDDEAASAR